MGNISTSLEFLYIVVSITKKYKCEKFANFAFKMYYFGVKIDLTGTIN